MLYKTATWKDMKIVKEDLTAKQSVLKTNCILKAWNGQSINSHIIPEMKKDEI